MTKPVMDKLVERVVHDDLRAIISSHTVLGGYPDTMAIARESYAHGLAGALSTLPADEGLREALERLRAALEAIAKTDTKDQSYSVYCYATDSEHWRNRSNEGPCAKLARAALSTLPSDGGRV